MACSESVPRSNGGRRRSDAGKRGLEACDSGGTGRTCEAASEPASGSSAVRSSPCAPRRSEGWAPSRSAARSLAPYRRHFGMPLRRASCARADTGARPAFVADGAMAPGVASCESRCGVLLLGPFYTDWAPAPTPALRRPCTDRRDGVPVEAHRRVALMSGRRRDGPVRTGADPPRREPQLPAAAGSVSVSNRSR